VIHRIPWKLTDDRCLFQRTLSWDLRFALLTSMSIRVNAQKVCVVAKSSGTDFSLSVGARTMVTSLHGLHRRAFFIFPFKLLLMFAVSSLGFTQVFTQLQRADLNLLRGGDRVVARPLKRHRVQ